jgi:hypothetical protein
VSSSTRRSQLYRLGVLERSQRPADGLRHRRAPACLDRLSEDFASTSSAVVDPPRPSMGMDNLATTNV